jgi:hypothetical protein
MPVFPATWEVEIRRITVRGQPAQKHKTYLKKYLKLKRAGGV